MDEVALFDSCIMILNIDIKCTSNIIKIMNASAKDKAIFSLQIVTHKCNFQ